MSMWIYIGLGLTGVYLAGLFVLSIYGNRLTNLTISDYFVANGSLSSVVIFLTMIASAFSAYTFLGGGGNRLRSWDRWTSHYRGYRRHGLPNNCHVRRENMENKQNRQRLRHAG